MENCLVTKLKGTVDNSNLKKFGRFYITAIESATPASEGYMIRWWEDLVDPTDNKIKVESGTAAIRVGGVDYQEYTIPKWQWDINTRFALVTTKGAVISFPNKYALMSNFTIGVNYNAIGADDLSYVTFEHNGNTLETFQGSIKGSYDVSNIRTSTGYVNISGAELYGDLTEAVKNYTGTYNYNLMVNIFSDNKVIVDFSKVALNIEMNVNPNNRVWLWKGTRTGNIVSFGSSYGPFNFGDDLDAMLINQANLDVFANHQLPLRMWVSGTKTSASDSAIATLKSKGFDVKINDEQM